MAAEIGKNTKNITRYQLEVTELIREMQNMTKEGKDAATQLSALGTRFNELKTRGEKLEGVMRFYASRTKDSAKATANLNTRLSALNTGVGKVTAAEKRLVAEVNKVNAARKREAAAIKKSIADKKKEAAATEKLAAAERKSALAKKKNTKATKESSKGIKAYGQGIGKALGTLARFAGAALIINNALKLFRFFSTGAIEAGAKFEAAVANLAAVAGASAVEVNELKEAALAVAKETKFTAVEVIGLQTELSKLGFSAKDVVAATASIAFGAQALGEGLEVVSSTVGKVINQFNLLAEESSVVVDTLVTTINESALSLSTFGTAIQYVGPLASGLGFSLQETAASMAVLADNGFTASRVGTGLRSIFTELGADTIDLKSKLKQLADENLSLSEAIDLVGKRNAAQLITLVDNISVLDESEDKYYQQGKALQSAALQADTFSGQMSILSSAINEYQIGIGQAIIETDFFRRILSSVSPEAGKVVNAFKLIKETGFSGVGDDIKDVVGGLDAFDVAVARAAEAYGKTIEEVLQEVRDNEDKTVYNRQQGTNQTVKQYTEIGSSVLGYKDKLKELAEQERKNILIQQERGKVQEQYQAEIDKLVVKEQLGENIIPEADALADGIKKRMSGVVDEIKIWEDIIDKEKDEVEKKRLGDQLLAQKAKLKELSNYYRLVANLIGIEQSSEEGSIAIQKRKTETFRELLDEYEDKKDAIKTTNELSTLENELNSDFMANTAARIEMNNDLKDKNDELITKLQEEISTRKTLSESEDANTKQGKYNIDAYNREIETLEKLIEKYNEKNEKLTISASTLSFAAENTKKQIAALKKEYDDGDITGGQLKIGEQQITENFKADLEALKAANPELTNVINAMVKNLELGYDVDWNAVLFKGIEEAISTTFGAIEGFNETAFENTKNRLEAEKDAIKSRYETEDYLAKQQLENGLINEAQYRARQQQLRKKQIAEENAIDKKLFDAENKKKKNDAKVDFLEALASIIPTLIKEGIAEPTTLNIMAAITGASAAASYAAEISAINQSKFYPKKFATGGMVNGPSHEQGGVPFSVQGQGGYEMEGGEFIVNKRAASLHRDLLDKINGSVRPNLPNQPMKYAQGGAVSSTITNVSQQSADSVNYLKAIAEATSTNAMNSSRPVRAFVTSTDLRRDESARRIKENNTTI